VWNNGALYSEIERRWSWGRRGTGEQVAQEQEEEGEEESDGEQLEQQRAARRRGRRHLRRLLVEQQLGDECRQ